MLPQQSELFSKKIPHPTPPVFIEQLCQFAFSEKRRKSEAWFWSVVTLHCQTTEVNGQHFADNRLYTTDYGFICFSTWWYWLKWVAELDEYMWNPLDVYLLKCTRLWHTMHRGTIINFLPSWWIMFRILINKIAYVVLGADSCRCYLRVFNTNNFVYIFSCDRVISVAE